MNWLWDSFFGRRSTMSWFRARRNFFKIWDILGRDFFAAFTCVYSRSRSCQESLLAVVLFIQSMICLSLLKAIHRRKTLLFYAAKRSRHRSSGHTDAHNIAYLTVSYLYSSVQNKWMELRKKNTTNRLQLVYKRRNNTQHLQKVWRLIRYRRCMEHDQTEAMNPRNL